MTRKILVTGGAGFIGANLVRRLLHEGNEVVVIDNLSRGFASYLPSHVTLMEGDIRDTPFLTENMNNADIVIHLAAYGSVVESVDDPYTNFDINAYGTFSVLDAARQAMVKKVIFASTGGALIGDAEPPVDEKSLPKPISPYGSSKLCGEAYCHSFAKVYGLNTICLRFANVYGPYSAHKKGAVTKFIKCLLKGSDIPIFGDGSASRDFLHVDDLCSGILSAIDVKNEPGEVYHLASENEVTILSLAKILSDIAGKNKHPISHFDKRPGEVARNFAKYDKAKRELGFEPKIDFKQGLQSTWQWFLERKDEVLNLKEFDS
ncbi:MAG: NAD-dependent epimerase/dehydratase family protein [Candidatus Electrothrix sp. AW3_4]|nr:NAD-dependent epimerase/dehydratase family protein [Candidatus Electrothrix gigas]